MVSCINATFSELLLVSQEPELVQELELHRASAQEQERVQELVQVQEPLQASALQPSCSRLQT